MVEGSIVYLRLFNHISSKGGHSPANRIFFPGFSMKKKFVNLASLL